MSVLLETDARALAALGVDLGGTAEVLRIDAIGKSHRALTVATSAGRRWFLLGEEEAQEVVPDRDPSLPFAARLRELRATRPVDVLAYRPHKRLVVRYGRPGATRVVKALRPGRLDRAVEGHRLFAGAASRSGLRVPELFEVDARMHALTLEDLGGRPLVLGADAPERFARIGHALRRVQQELPPTSLPVHDASAELAELDRQYARADALTGLASDPAARTAVASWRETRADLDQTVAEWPAGGRVAVHRDFHDRQLLELGGATGLIDFDMASPGDDALDVANLAAHLELRMLQHGPGATRALVLASLRSLRAGMHRDAEPGFDRRFRFYRAATFLRLALVYRLRPQWSKLFGPLVERAATRAAEVCHVE